MCGTVGDIESLPFLEALRQMELEDGHSNTLFIHVTLPPVLDVVGEQKTKPTQHSVQERRPIGIQPTSWLLDVKHLSLAMLDIKFRYLRAWKKNVLFHVMTPHLFTKFQKF